MPFAIITFRHDGPIKTWSAMEGANVHNARTKPIAHGVPGAPPPEHLVGTGDLVRDVKRTLKACRIPADRLRKNGVIAFEAVMTASPAFFEDGTLTEQASRLQAWKLAQVKFAEEQYGKLAVASMVLHLDEKTPHIHLVVVPLEFKADGRTTAGEMKWGLVGRTISGPGKFDQLQDDYAEAMAPFGLVRGERHSGRKKEPPAIFMKRMAEQQCAIAEREAELQRTMEEFMRLRATILEEDERERKLAQAEAAKVRVAAEAMMQEAERMMHEAQTLMHEAAHRADVTEKARAEIAAELADAKAARVASECDHRTARDHRLGEEEMRRRAKVDCEEAQRTLAAVVAIAGDAEAVRKALVLMPADQRPPERMEVHRRASVMERVAADVFVPSDGIEVATFAALRKMQKRGVALRR